MSLPSMRKGAKFRGRVIDIWGFRWAEDARRVGDSSWSAMTVGRAQSAGVKFTRDDE